MSRTEINGTGLAAFIFRASFLASRTNNESFLVAEKSIMTIGMGY